MHLGTLCAQWLLMSLLAAVPAAAAPPKLLVAIVVDQFSADLFNEYRGHFSGGLQRLSQGVVFPRGYQSHAATETCPGHSTILTGARPARTGIIANDWQIPAMRQEKNAKPSFDIYCVQQFDSTTHSAGAEISAQWLRVPTLGDRLKAVEPHTRVVAVAGKDRAAVMLGGARADLTVWWNGTAFDTYASQRAALPVGLVTVSQHARASIAAPVEQVLPKQCAAHDRQLFLDAKTSVGKLTPLKAGDEARWRATPAFDSAILDAALMSLSTLRLGQGPAPDVLAISFSATDYVGHRYGTAGAEMCAQVLALDATLQRLFMALDKLKVSYAVVLTADHGGHDVPERNAQRALPSAQRVDAQLAPRTVGIQLAKQFNLSGNPLLGRSPAGDMYLSLDVPATQRDAVRAAAVATYRTHPQVAAVFTKEELLAAPMPVGPADEWTLLDRAKASFDAERSGDFVVLLKPYVVPIASAGQGYVATHGSPWDYDRRVPILFWWPGIEAFEQPNAVETVDILPTLASLVGLFIPVGDIDGRCLDLLPDAADNCPH